MVPMSQTIVDGPHKKNNKRTNVYLTWKGKTQTLHKRADTLGVKYDCLYSRYRRKWKTKDILFGKSK